MLDLELFDRVIAKVGHLRWSLYTRILYVPRMRSAGRNVVIRKPLMLRGLRGMTIGANVHVRDGARIELIRRDDGPEPQLMIGNNVLIEQQAHIVCCERVFIGDDVAIAPRCSIVDVAHPVHDPVGQANLGNAISTERTWVEIGKGAFLGTGTVVLPRTRIGEGAVVGAGSVVTHDVPAWSIVAGAPAKVIGERERK